MDPHEHISDSGISRRRKVTSITRITLIVVLLLLVLGVIVYDVEQYVSISMLKQKKAVLENLVAEYPFRSALAFFIMYIIFTSFFIPGSLVLTLAGGALFGRVLGVVMVSFASTIGATNAFLMSRYLLRKYVHDHFGDKLRVVMDGFEREGAFYLFSLRLVPVIPFVVLNLMMGLTHIHPVLFFFTSQLGMLPSTLIFVDAGTRLVKINSARDIVSVEMMASFVAIGLLPLVCKRAVIAMKARYGKKKERGGSSGNLGGPSNVVLVSSSPRNLGVSVRDPRDHMRSNSVSNLGF